MRIAIAAAVVVAALLLVPLAQAHGNPASEVLLGRSMFIPPDAGIGRRDAAAIGALLDSARTQGYPLRVAVIATRYDLGSLAELFDRPADYARHLSEDLSPVYKGRVLVATPRGYAVARRGKRDADGQAAIAALASPKPFQGAALAAGIEQAIRRLAARAGIELPATPPPAGGGSRSTTIDRIAIGIGGAALMLFALGVTLLRRRSHSVQA